MATSKTGDSTIVIAPRWKVMEVTIKGDSPLAMQSRPKSVIENLNRKDNGLPQIKYKSTDWRRFIDSIHWIDERKKPDTLDSDLTDDDLKNQFLTIEEEARKNKEPLFYIPCEAFKESICKGAYRSKYAKDLVSMRGSFIIMHEKAPIQYDSVEMEKVPTVNKNAKGAMVISVYSKFNNWSTKLKIRYNEELISAENLVNIICNAGWTVGILARRTELSFGKYGTYTATQVAK